VRHRTSIDVVVLCSRSDEFKGSEHSARVRASKILEYTPENQFRVSNEFSRISCRVG
jgi:hypothetical protein